MSRKKKDFAVIKMGSSAVWLYCDNERQALFEASMLNVNNIHRRSLKDTPYRVVQVNGSDRKGGRL